MIPILIFVYNRRSFKPNIVHGEKNEKKKFGNVFDRSTDLDDHSWGRFGFILRSCGPAEVVYYQTTPIPTTISFNNPIMFGLAPDQQEYGCFVTGECVSLSFVIVKFVFAKSEIALFLQRKCLTKPVGEVLPTSKMGRHITAVPLVVIGRLRNPKVGPVVAGIVPAVGVPPEVGDRGRAVGLGVLVPVDRDLAVGDK